MQRTFTIRPVLLGTVFATVFAINSAYAAPTETIIHNFILSGGASPDGPLLVGPSGALFGTTAYGGSGLNGTVFELDPPTVAGQPWKHTVLYNFTGGADGGQPAAGLIMSTGHALFGATENSNGVTNGVVFRLTPPAIAGGAWTFNVLYTFTGGIDGGNPNCTLLFDSSGNLFGTTTLGGSSGLGTVFKLTAPTTPGNPWTEHVLHNFIGGADGGNPYAGVVRGSTGTLFGASTTGGLNSSGAVWAIIPPSGSGTFSFQSLYEFTGGADGSQPFAPILVTPAGALYGTTFVGGSANGDNGFGVVFKLTPPVLTSDPYTESVIYTFNGTGADGANPSGALISNGSGGFYGTTTGANFGSGNVFKLTPSGSSFAQSVIYTFDGAPDGQAPLANVSVDASGAIYGTTYYGGSDGAGTVFIIK